MRYTFTTRHGVECQLTYYSAAANFMRFRLYVGGVPIAGECYVHIDGLSVEAVAPVDGMQRNVCTCKAAARRDTPPPADTVARDIYDAMLRAAELAAIHRRGIEALATAKAIRAASTREAVTV